MFAGKKSAQNREILISESAWEEMTCLFAPSLSQQDADDYHEYIMEWHRGQVNPTSHITEAASQEIIGYKYENGLLVPV